MTFDILLKRAMLLRQDLGRLPDESIRSRNQKIAARAAQLYFAHAKCGSPGFGRITTTGAPPLDELTEDLVEMGRRYLKFGETLVYTYCPFHDGRQIYIFRNGKKPISPEPWNGPSRSESGREKGDVIGYGTEILQATLEDELDNTICTLEVLARLGTPDLRLSPTLAFSPQEGTDHRSCTSSSLSINDIPLLDKENGEWCLQKQAARLTGKSMGTLGNDRSAGRKLDDGLQGIDRRNRVWRKENKNSQDVWYLKSSLSNAMS